MSIAKVRVSLKGLPPGMLQHRFPMEPIEALEKKPKEEQAEIFCYRNKQTKELYIPGSAVQQTFIAAASYSKGKGRATLAKIAAASMFVTPEMISLGTDKFEIDARPVVVPATGGRVVRYRPLIPEWTATFDISFEKNLLREEQVRRIVNDAGSLVGFLDYRPACKGPFGRFMVTKWELLDAADDDDPEVDLADDDLEEEV